MGTREIVTLQFGHYANFVGAHWWNIQEQGFEYDSNKQSEINHDVLFREGCTDKGAVTYTPRLLLADLKGSLKTLSTRGTLYETHDVANVSVAWQPELLDVKQEKSEMKNKFQQNLDKNADEQKLSDDCNLDEEVRVWSDFLYTRFHPRTVNVINEYEHEGQTSEFDLFPLGRNLWHDFEDFGDKIRNYVEECDCFQGFQVILDGTDGFAGLSAGCVEYLRDEYETKSILAFPLLPGYYSDYNFRSDEEESKSRLKDSVRVLNLGFCFDSLVEHSSMFVPMSVGSKGWRQPGAKREFHRLVYDNKSSYHSSAILAAALDTLTLPYRIKSTNYTLADLSVDLTRQGRKAVAASLCLPFSFNKGADFLDCLDNWDGPLSQSITPDCTIGTDRLMQIMTLRGIPESRLKRPFNTAGKQQNTPAYKCKTVNEMLSYYMSCTCYASATNVTNIETPLNVVKPFPNIFQSSIGIDGNIQPDPRPQRLGVQSVPVLAGFHAGSFVGNTIENLHSETKRIRFQKLHRFKDAGLDLDDFKECLDRLFDLRECYEENYNI